MTFSLDWRPEPAEIPARACSCSFCLKHGGLWTSCPTGSLRITIRQPALVSRYSFGTRTAEFQVCSSCGVVPVVTSRIDGRLYAVVSVNAFQNIDPALLKRVAATYDGESESARLARRKLNWIADVEVQAGNG
ncbi:MAG: hypothetical protein E6K41_08885 [Gammaproteobacteria bacterium]|nr:MAG: hypothetical protein E6K41_08885 [Gammaproteobacteria bacterium]